MESDNRHSADRFWLGPVAGLVLLILLGTVYYAVSRPPTAPKPAATLVPVTVSEIASLTFHSQNQTLTLYQSPAQAGGASWRIGAATGEAADSSLVGSFVGGLVTLTASRTLSSSPTAADLKAYGLAPPTSSVSVARTGGRPALQLDLGTQSPVGSYYAQVAGQATVYLVDGMVPSEISADPKAWLPVPATPSSTAPASSATTSGPAAASPGAATGP